MARVPLRPLIEYAFRDMNGDTPLQDWVLARRRDGASWDQIAGELTRRTDGLSVVTGASVRNWYVEVDPTSSPTRRTAEASV